MDRSSGQMHLLVAMESWRVYIERDTAVAASFRTDVHDHATAAGWHADVVLHNLLRIDDAERGDTPVELQGMGKRYDKSK